jgi:chitinase
VTSSSDYFGSWDKKIGLNAPIENDVELNVKYSIDYFLKLGAPANKLVVGLPFYGRTFVSRSNEGNIGDESDDQGFQGPFTRENGFMGYNEICQSLSNTSSELNWETNWDVESSEAVAKVKTASDTRVVTYDSPRSIANKARYAVQKGLLGLMVWSIDTDDFQGDCKDSLNEDRFSDFRTKPKVKLNFPKSTIKTYPLLRTLNDAIVLTLDEMNQEQNINLDKENEIDSNEQTKPKPNEPSHATATALSSFIALTSFVVFLKML